MNQTTRIGEIAFEHGFPAKETVGKLYDEIDFQRACQAYLWGVPAVSFQSLRAGLRRDFGASDYDICIWDNFCDARLINLTANTTTIYALTTFDVGKDGPVVIEIPAGATAGMVDDFWQRSLSDIGLPGPDQGQGSAFLVVPPGYRGDVPGEGSIILQATQHTHNFMIRGIVEGDDVAAAVSRLKQVRVYPLSARANPTPNRFLSVSGKPGNMIPVSGMAYWESLAAFISENPVEPRDRFFLAMLKPLGIEKGKPFAPTARQRQILEEGAVVGEAMARAALFATRLSGATKYEGTHWEWAAKLNADQETEYYSQLDERLDWFFGATYMTPAMIGKQAGQGSQYIQAFKDKDGDWFDGGKTYRMHVPADVPVKAFWSVTLYDNVDRSMVQNTTGRPAVSSYDDLQDNADGSIDLYFGPTAPPGKESNWIQTVSDGFFPWFRAYSPTEAFFDNTWSLPDVEKA